jgi:hypothetical protein
VNEAAGSPEPTLPLEFPDRRALRKDTARSGGPLRLGEEEMTEPLTDDELMARDASGDEDAFRILV